MAMQEVEEHWKKYTEPVTIVVEGQYRLSWIPGRPDLAGVGIAREISSFVRDYIHSLAGNDNEIMVTPEGPSLTASTRSIYTTVWALTSLYGDDVEFIGDAPTLRDMGVDEASNTDENGKLIIR
jgi:hypothetical protein